MFDLRYTREDQSFPALVADGQVIQDEGYALVVAGAKGNAYGVKLSTGATTEDFVGVSAFETRPPPRIPIVKEFVLPADTSAATDGGTVGTIIESAYGAVIASSVAIFRTDTGVALGADNTPGANKQLVYIENGVLKIRVGAAALPTGALTGGSFVVTDLDGVELRVQASYIPTLERQLLLVGSHVDAHPLSAGASVSAIRRGLIYTSAFETQDDWSIGGDVYTAAGGLFSSAAGGVKIPGAFVAHVPTVDVPFIGFEFA